MNRPVRYGILFACFFLALWTGAENAAASEKDTEQKEGQADTVQASQPDEQDIPKTDESELTEEEIRRQEAAKTGEALIEDLEIEQMQDAVNQLLGEDAFNLEDALRNILRGEKLFSGEFFEKLFRDILYDNLIAEKETMIRILILVLLAALFSNFSNVFGEGHTGEISFYIVYMLLLVSMVHAFGEIGTQIGNTLENFIAFMKALMPSYFLAVTAAGGSSSAMVFYESALLLIYLVQAVFQKMILPGVHVYVLLELVNYLHSEDFLSRMAELMKMLLDWGIKTCVAIVIGMQLIQNMVSPAIDSLKRDMIGKTAASLPGIGNAINGVTEVVLGTAVLVRNGLGVMGIIILLLVGIPPLIRLGVTAFLYKFLAALVQPISDKRMVGALATMGEGCILFLKVMSVLELLFIITIAILTVSFIGH